MTNEDGDWEPDIPGVDWVWGEDFKDLLLDSFQDVDGEVQGRVSILVSGARTLDENVEDGAAVESEAVNLAIDARRHYEDWASLYPLATRGFPVNGLQAFETIGNGLTEAVEREEDARSLDEAYEAPSDLGVVTRGRAQTSLVMRTLGAEHYVLRGEEEDAGSRVRTHLVDQNRHFLRLWGASVTASQVLVHDAQNNEEEVVPAHLQEGLGGAFKLGIFLHALGHAYDEDIVDLDWPWPPSQPTTQGRGLNRDWPGTAWG